MNAEEWERIKALFDAAVQRPIQERRAWLESACGDRLDLFETLCQLVKDYEQSSWMDPRSAIASPVFAPGDLVAGRFLILRLLAHGGMGEVYEATDNCLRGIKVALKTLRPGLASEKQAYERFKREVWVAREIAHPGICRVFDLIEHKTSRADGSAVTIPCLTMSLLEGESLAAHLSRFGPLSIDAALPVIRQLVGCIKAMHDNNIVHRDIKPSNIMLVPAPDHATQHAAQIVLIDFGLAKPINNRTEAWETKAEQHQPGAPYFVPPEALRGEHVGPPADIYALGLVLDEMVTTRPAYRHDSIEELFWRKLHERPEPPSARSSGLPAVWNRTILRCLDVDPSKRPQTAEEVLKDLEHAAESKISELTSAVIRSLWPVRRPSLSLHSHSRRKWIAGVCSGAFAAAGLGAYQAQRSEDLSTSVLVLPFENLMGQQEAFEGLCIATKEELVRRLSYVKGLSVLEAPGSWRPDERDLKGIRFLLRGTLQEIQDTPQLTMQLTDVHSKRIVWAESFGRGLKEPIQLESLLTTRTIDELRGNAQTGRLGASWINYRFFSSLGSKRNEFLPPQATTNTRAALSYQRGRGLWKTRSLSSCLEAIKAYEDAIQADPNYALAYAALADVQHTLLNYSYGSTRQLMSQAIAYAEKAVSIDESLPECHVALAAAKQNLWAWSDSEASYKLAIAKNPKFARAYQWYAGLLLQYGSFNDALAMARTGIDLAPFDYPARSNHGLYLWYAGQGQAAARHLELVLEKSNVLFARVVLGCVYAYLASQSSEPDATRYFDKSIQHAGAVRVQELNDSIGPEPMFLKWSDLMFVQSYAARRDNASATNYMERLERGFDDGKTAGTVLAWGYAALKQWKKTLEMLEYGAEQQEREMLYVKVHPSFRPLGNNPRYISILKRMQLV